MFKLFAFSLVTVVSVISINPSAVRALTITTNSAWNTTGQTTLENGEAFLETCYFDADGGCNEDVRITDFTGLQAFLPTLPNNLNVQEGSAIKQQITANAGDILTFDWNFLTQEDPSDEYNDFAFFTIGNYFEILADTKSNELTDDFLSGFNKSTGKINFSYTIQNTGTYTLGFGVVDVGPDDSGFYINSALEITPTAVPEPVTILGTLTALALGVKFKNKYS